MHDVARAILLAASLALAGAARPAATEEPATPAPGARPADMPTVVVEGQEPQYVVPTRRDRIGRIWAPVYINGQGPFRLAFDTGASRSGVTAALAAKLGLAPDEKRTLRLRGVTGTSRVPTIRAERFQVGDLLLEPLTLPVLADAFGGAEGILGTDGLGDRRVRIEFRRDRIVIARSHGERAEQASSAAAGARSRLLIADARVGRVPVKVIIGTGGRPIGNNALRDALARPPARNPASIASSTSRSRSRPARRTAPTIALGDLRIRGARVTYGDMHLFEYLHMVDRPALLLGMDTLGLLDCAGHRLPPAQLQAKLADGR
ncbi:MAG: retropepsin-like aspartic protease [Steroidobacteraceae bacterium]